MKVRTTLLTLAVCLLAMAAYAADNPNMGTWKLNEAKSKIPAGATKNTTVVYAAAGDSVKVTTDGTNGKGDPIHTEWTGKIDGKPYPLTGDPSADMRAYTQVNARTLSLVNSKGGKPVTTGKITVSADGKSRTLDREPLLTVRRFTAWQCTTSSRHAF